MQVLVVNSGSSSLKFELFSTEPERSVLKGEVERIGQNAPALWLEGPDASGKPSREQREVAAPDHRSAFAAMASALETEASSPLTKRLGAVGHRVVHGGERFTGPTLIDGEVIARIEEASELAPLHNPANLAGIEAARRLLPDVPQVAVFDTAFHRTLPPHAREYALPRDLVRTHHLYRFGFHGTSHEYVSKRAAEMLGRRIEELDLITLHLGNGASATAIHAGRSVDTSMGTTPLEGLVMGTRCGDIDPAIPLLLQRFTGRTEAEVDELLNHRSGLLGLAGANDMRDLHRMVAQGDEAAGLALDVFCYRVRKYIGAYYAALGRLDAVVFTAGIGENDPEVRSCVCAGLDRLGICVDETLNHSEGGGARRIHRAGSEVEVLVIPTNEELEIARQTLSVVAGRVPSARGV